MPMPLSRLYSTVSTSPRRTVTDWPTAAETSTSASLPPRRLDMPEALRDAVLECKRFTRHEAVRRQMQYIGKLMRGFDAAPLAAQVASMHAPSHRDTALFHLAEKWRDEMVEDPRSIDRF